MVWLIATLFGFSLLTFILSIPSIYVLFKSGYKSYFNNINFLYKEYKNLNKCYKIETNVNYNFVYQDGTRINKTVKDIKYYLPLISDNLVYLIESDGIFWQIKITKYEYVDNSWSLNEFVIKYNNCIYTMLLYDRFLKRVKKLTRLSNNLKDLEDLNNLINSDIKSIRRENKINLIFNE